MTSRLGTGKPLNIFYSATKDPFHFVLFESPFVSASTVSRNHPSSLSSSTSGHPTLHTKLIHFGRENLDGKTDKHVEERLEV